MRRLLIPGALLEAAPPGRFCGNTDHQADSDSWSGSSPKLIRVGDLPDLNLLATADFQNT
jgi:hypothetical protein